MATKCEPKIDHLSASQINLYQQCGLKYRFQYVDRLPRPFRPSGLAFGSVIHSTLDWFHKEKIKGDGISLGMVLKVFEADWFSQKVEDEIRYKNGETEADLLTMGKNMLTQYFHAYQETPVAAEVPFSLPLIELVTGEVLGPTLDGKMDLVGKDGVVEFKTAAKSLSERDIKDMLQLTCYGYAYRMLFQKDLKSFKVVVFVKNRTPKMLPLETSRDQQDYRRFFYVAKEVLKGITSRVFFPNPSFMCKDCEYESPCQVWLGDNPAHAANTVKKGGVS